MLQREHFSLKSLFVYLVYLYVILLPIGTGLAGIIGDISIMNYIAVLIILIGFAINSLSGKLRFSRITIPTLVYFGYTALSCLWSSNTDLTWYVATNIVNGVIFFILNCYEWTEIEIGKLDKCFIISQLIVYVAVLTNIDSMFVYRLNITIVSTIGIGDFAVGLCLLIAFWMNNAAKATNKYYKSLSYVVVLSNLLIILMAGSRGGLVMFFVMIAIWIVMGDYQIRTKAIIVSVIVIAYFFITLEFIDYLPDVIKNRMTMQAVRETNGSGRFEIWQLAFEHFKSSNFVNMLFGHGFNSFLHEISYGSHGGVHDLMAHNTVVQTLIEGGIIGILILFRMVYSQIQYAWKRKDTMMLLAVVGLFVASLSNDMQVTRIWGLILTLNCVKEGLFQKSIDHSIINAE